MIIVVSHSYIFLYKRWLILSYSKRFSKLKYAWLLEAFSLGPLSGLWSGPAGGLPDPLLIFSCLSSLTNSIWNTKQCYDIKYLEKPLLCLFQNMPIILCLTQVRKPTKLWGKYEVTTQSRSSKIFYIDHFGGIFRVFWLNHQLPLRYTLCSMPTGGPSGIESLLRLELSDFLGHETWVDKKNNLNI